MNGLRRWGTYNKMGHYSAVKINKIMPFVATWMQLEILILSEKDKYHTTYMWNLKYDTNKPIYKTETDSVLQIESREQTCGCQGREGRKWDGWGVWGWQMQTITFRIDKQEFPLWLSG